MLSEAQTAQLNQARQKFKQEQAPRREAMERLRLQVKQSRFRYGDIARRCGNSTGWVGEVLRGGYPYGGGYWLPKNIRVALQELGFEVPEILWTF